MDNQLFESLFIISRFLRGEVTTDSKKQHLTILQLQALGLLRERGELQMWEIADHFKVTKPTATHLLNNLDKLGLITRLRDNRDRRAVKVRLSQEGEELLKRAIHYKQQKIKQLLSYLPRQDQADLTRIMDTLAEKLSKKIE